MDPLLTKDQIERLGVDELKAIIESDAHYRQTSTRNYGSRDPLEDPAELAWRCACGSPTHVLFEPLNARQSEVAGGGIRSGEEAYFVSCRGCAVSGPPSRREWRAVVDWNYLRARSGGGSLADFPFFQLDGLDGSQALAKLQSIRYDLTLRRALERKRKARGDDVGGRYLAKLDALLGWSTIGVAVLQRRAVRRREKIPSPVRQHQMDSAPKAESALH